jgi:hypothetical protein
MTVSVTPLVSGFRWVRIGCIVDLLGGVAVVQVAGADPGTVAGECHRDGAADAVAGRRHGHEYPANSRSELYATASP